MKLCACWTTCNVHVDEVYLGGLLKRSREESSSAGVCVLVGVYLGLAITTYIYGVCTIFFGRETTKCVVMSGVFIK